jgi:uncharacterized protein YndB with AHSA1/START domain
VNLEIDRVFDAPRAQVWDAWTDPAQLSQWWGPHHFHVPQDSIEIELRPGGRYHLTMVETSSGREFPALFEIVELREAELLVFVSPPQPEHGLTDEIHTRVEFADAGDGTRVTVVSGPYTDQMGPNAETGWAQQFEKLDSVLGVPADHR